MGDARTEEATPRRLREARRDGNVWQSRELGAALALLTAATVLGATGASIVAAHASTFQLAIDVASGRVASSPGALLEASIAIVAAEIAPLLIALVVVGALASLLQVGPLFAPRAISFSPARLDPIAGARRLVSAARAIELLKALAIVAVVVAAALFTVRDGMRGTLALAGRGALPALHAAGTLGRALLLRTGGALLAIAALDVLYQRWRWHRELRMTRREVEREHEATEGSPHAKRERARARQELLSPSVLEATRQARVLVVSRHALAVALRFDEDLEGSVPVVAATGRDALAPRMIAAATEVGVAVDEDPALAQALLALEVGRDIPAALYEPVAAAIHRTAPPGGRADVAKP